MTREKKALLTSFSSMLHQIISLVCGFILPRLFLARYGSTVNGLTSSITQFLGFITLAECGVGSVVQSSLYKPLAEKNVEEISKIFKSSNRFFNKLGIILFVYTILLAVFYPFIVAESFDYIFTASLILIISISTFARYYLGMSYRMIVGADQYGFVNHSLSCIALLLNTAACVVLIKLDMPIHVVKLVSSLIFFAQPVILLMFAKRKYTIDTSVVLTEEPIKQKWNGLAQHIASVVNGNTDTVVLTLFSTLENVSVYAVYHMVVNGIKSIVSALTNGYIAMFGNMLAKKETQVLNATFSAFEWLIHTITTLSFALTCILIVPFVGVYTRGVEDVNYIVPTFGMLISIAQASYCLRLPYSIMTMAACHYKQTQVSSVIEALLNIVVSVVFVFKFGLVGVAIGTLTAMLYRTCYLAIYLSKNIINRHIKHFIKHGVVDILSFCAMIYATSFLNSTVSNYREWVILALKCGVICLALAAAVNLLLYRDDIRNCRKYILHHTRS